MRFGGGGDWSRRFPTPGGFRRSTGEALVTGGSGPPAWRRSRGEESGPGFGLQVGGTAGAGGAVNSSFGPRSARVRERAAS
ncbi:hypothetical protein CDL15_Pgr020881 [Punica granatum]|uniref:Uncharacterized protein n=1 Tax=Punica granatum TaxID=22663 RepID=A0A218XVD4_PUNGR|nr:hypothetical protein CDL15_Pgr020878 [Punica granatum]OWM88927.1 hypothetical protein CDL15_Pgr020881 [Punica granatum]